MFETVAEMREVHSAVKWEGKARSADVDTRFLNQHVLARYMAAYCRTGCFPVTGVDILAACHRDSSMKEMVEAIRLELQIRASIVDMYEIAWPLASLTKQFFEERSKEHRGITDKLRYSILHTDIHRAFFSDIVYMCGTAGSMLEHYFLSHQRSASVLRVVTCLESAIFYKDALTTRFPYKNALWCYYMQCVPLARWVYDVCEFMTVLNKSWNVTGKPTH